MIHQAYRESKEAAKCKHLYIGRSGKYLDAPTRLEFVCTNPKVTKEHPHAQFGTLDICCVCKHWEVSKDDVD